MVFEDQLVRNYLDSAARRFEELQELRHLQCQELQDRLSSPPISSAVATSADRSEGTSTLKSTTTTTTMTQHSPSPFNRQNTLLLTGRSKFYTLSHEQHCVDPPDAGPPASDDATSRPASSSSRRRGHLVTIVDHQLNGTSKSPSTVSSASSSPASSTKPLAVGVGVSKTSGGVKKPNLLSGALDNNNNDASKGSDDGIDDWSSYRISRDSDARVVCMHAGRPNEEYLCTQCYDANEFAQNFSRAVGYPTSHTKL